MGVGEPQHTNLIFKVHPKELKAYLFVDSVGLPVHP